MKHTLSALLLLAALTGPLTACDSRNKAGSQRTDSVETESTEQPHTDSTTRQTTAELRARTDSAIQCLDYPNMRMDDLKDSIASAEKRQETIDDELTKMEKASRIWGNIPVVTLVLAALVCLLSLICLWQARKKAKASHRWHDAEKRLEELNKSTDWILHQMEEMKKDIARIDKKRDYAPPRSTNPTSPTTNWQSKEKEKPAERRPTEVYKYVKEFENEYFTAIKDTKEGCYFRIILSSDSAEEGEFDTDSLVNLKQKDGWEKIAEAKYGGCAKENAQNFEVLAKGRCEKDGDSWRVTKKMEIELKG